MNVLIINALIAIFFSFFAIIKKRAPIVSLILGIWAFSSLSGILYMTGFLMIDELKVQPFVYLDVCLFFMLIPLFYFDKNKILISESIIKKVEYLLFAVGCLSILPFIEHCIYFVQTYIQSGGESTIVDTYNEKMSLGHENIITWLDPLSLNIEKSLGRFNPIVLFLFFLISIKRSQISNLKFFIYLTAVLRPLISNLNCSGRVSFVFFCLSFALLFLIFRKKLIIQIPKFYYILGIVIVILFFLAIVTISLLRVDSSGVDMTVWISLYCGEGTVNFAESMWNMKCTTLGDNCFSYFKSLLGLETFIDQLARREFWSIDKTGVDPVRFYTFIGDWFIDFGRNNLVLFVLTLSFLFKRLLKRTRYGIVSTFMIYIYCNILTTGFTYYSYKSYYATHDVVTCIIIVLLIKILSKKTDEAQDLI